MLTRCDNFGKINRLEISKSMDSLLRHELDKTDVKKVIVQDDKIIQCKIRNEKNRNEEKEGIHVIESLVSERSETSSKPVFTVGMAIHEAKYGNFPFSTEFSATSVS